MKRAISGRRREDFARRTIIAGTAVAAMPVLAPAVTVSLDTAASTVVVATVVSTISAAAVVGLLFVRISRRIAMQQCEFDRERRHWRDEAYTDPLCGIANRRGAAFEIERRRRELAGAGQLTVMALDVDHFKSVNDRHGHAVGDRVLVSVATVVSQHLPLDTMVARWGGDEFVVLRFGHGDVPEDWADAIVDAVSAKPVPCREGDLYVTVSYGIAHGPSTGDFDDMLAAADDELLAAKALHRASERFEPSIDVRRVANRRSPNRDELINL